MTNQICQTTSVSPHMYNKKSLASIIIAPQGELPQFLPSSFVRNEALSFPAISWNMSFDIKSHPFPLSVWPRQMFVIFIYVAADDPAELRLQRSMPSQVKDLLRNLMLKANLGRKWGNCGLFHVKKIVWGFGEVVRVLLHNSWWISTIKSHQHHARFFLVGFLVMLCW